ncbi:MAG TPA: Gfo/Idh/MocA family oxidoreductase [Bryobacteraceae bacterium]|nr:Gfo/Idh/MocA family oxidoreductase [Bryobacteraceae bacterium]
MESNRRDFLKSSAIISAAPMFVPQRAFGANDRVTYGVIATGGRGRYLNKNFQAIGGQCVALCDVYEPNLELAKKDSPEGVKTYLDYHELLEQPGVDIVVLAGPDHHHCPMLLAALKAKKDVYAEKPLSYSFEDSKKMVDAVKSSDRIVQVGMQRRSSPSVMRAKQLIDDGIIGDVYQVRPQWDWNVARPLDNTPLAGNIDWDRFLGPAPKRALEPMRFRAWRQFYDYAGGNMTDQGTHLMDVAQWFLKSGPPKAAIMHGFIAKTTGAEQPDVFTAVFEYPKHLITWTLNYTNAYENGWSIKFMGDKGTMILEEGGWHVYAEPWKTDAPAIFQELAVGPGAGLTGTNAVQAHFRNLVECVRSREQPHCTVETAAQAVAGPHLANIAFKQGRKVTYNEAVRT